MSLATRSFEKEPEGAYFYGEDDGEKIILLLRKHFITNLGWLTISAILFTLPGIVGYLADSLKLNPLGNFPPAFRFIVSAFWYILSSVYFFESFIIWFFNVYIVTNKRVVDMDFFGLLYRSTSEAPLRNIEDVTNSMSGAAQVIFNYGFVMIETAGEIPHIEFEYVPNPSKVQDIVSDMVAFLKQGDPA